jgi:HTH-type transcriptional regulator/antitoxin HigA
MQEPEETRHVPKVLSGYGIRFVVVEHLSHTRMDGAALWITPESPVVAMSMRFARLDYFWFTLLHEVAHILYGDGERADPNILDLPADDLDEAELRANNQAADWLIPRDKIESFILRTTPLYSTQRVMNFSNRMGVHPAIVVGQLKNRGELKPNQFTRLQLDDIRSIIKQVAICDGWGHMAPVIEDN